MRNHHLTRRAAAGGLLLSTLFAAASARAQISIGPISTDDFKNLGKMLKGLSLNEEDEIRLGNTYYGPVIDALGGVYANRSVQSDIDRFAAPLFQSATRTNFAWEVTVVDNNEINAWVLPGGKLGVNKGLLRYVDSEDELAAVVAHEMGHAEKSHALGEMKKESFAEGLSGTAQKALVSEIDGTAGALAGAGVAVATGPMLRLVTSAYSRKDELEADQHIIEVFGRTGYDVRAGCRFYETLLETIPPKSKGTNSLFAGHPDTQKRLDALLEASEGLTPSGAPTTGGQAYAGLKETFPTRHHYLRNAG